MVSSGPNSASDNDRPPAGGFCVLLFDKHNRIGVTRESDGDGWAPPIVGVANADESIERAATVALAAVTDADLRVTSLFSVNSRSGRGIEVVPCEVFVALIADPLTDHCADFDWLSVHELRARAQGDPASVSPLLRTVLDAIGPHLIRVPYLNFGENDYIYQFRTEGQRNREVYASDAEARAIYESKLCEAIKAVKRRRERTAESPASLDFGAVRYVLPSHFGFCLGVQNAIERAYETIAAHPGRRVYMISELIHNPFVNDDLRARGLVYLQSDRGEPFRNPETGQLWWDELQTGDIVLTPAFGATDEDKVRLVERGVALNRYDATCMLVEKVWKAARRFARAGYTIVIHGKAEHEETKATFSNCAKYGPSLVVRNQEEAENLGRIILAPTRAEKLALFAALAERHTPDFDPERDLERIAVVNQTTLLRNETLGIIDHLERVMVQKYGTAGAGARLNMQSRGDTLCYATQVNQDALGRALAESGDVAIVVGGRNSSNTFQLFRMCEERFGDRAFYIQSERNIVSHERIEHYIFPYQAGAPGAGSTVVRPFLPQHGGPVTVLITGGASCPDGIIQQVINRINALFPAGEIRGVGAVLAEIEAEA